MDVVEYDLRKLPSNIRKQLLDWMKIKPHGKTLKVPEEYKQAVDDFIWCRYFEEYWGMNK